MCGKGDSKTYSNFAEYMQEAESYKNNLPCKARKP